MATLAAQQVPLAGLAVNLAAATAGGDQAPTGESMTLVMNNGDAAAHTVTLATPGNVHGLDIADRDVVVAAGALALIPLVDDYRDPSTGLASITYDDVTSVTVAVVRR